MNRMPDVDSLIKRCSSRAPWRAASEWMRACGCQEGCGSCRMRTHALDNNSAQAMRHEDDRTLICLFHLSLEYCVSHPARRLPA
jgi:hypothetical protein